MAYTFMAESSGEVDWSALHRAVTPIRKRIELFPVPPSNGLGLSIPQRLRNELAWEEFTQLLEVLRQKFGMEVFDLATGQKVDPGTLESVKGQFIAE